MHGSKGLLRAGNVHMSTVEVATGAGFMADPVQNFFLERYAAAYRDELDAFLNAVTSGTAPRPPAKTACAPRFWPMPRLSRRKPARPSGSADRLRGGGWSIIPPSGFRLADKDHAQSRS